MRLLVVTGRHTHTRRIHIRNILMFNNTQLLERRLCVVLCIYVFTTRIPRASEQGFAAYQAFVLLYTPQPTMLLGVTLGCFFFMEGETKFEFLDKRVFLGHTNGGEVIRIMGDVAQSNHGRITKLRCWFWL